ncbi:M1 family aminopeptidase [uncultured Dokdonia sp.]|uniref:ABC transporter permease/M1 family aminopeptidase n=1 Tax=uncultured Dokdonia sp. TaxID=575653 RepID=UPI002634FDFA|nr:M1 family aminopeptidase [uncultured Dokdonia sp.]
MFSTIYLHEIKTWFKKPLFYIFASIMFLLGVLIMAIGLGVFSSDNVTVTSNVYLNSPLAITGILSQLSLLSYMLIPSITGGTIHRDFKNNMHNVLYSYPLTKFKYLLAKFAAGITINLGIAIAIILGLLIGSVLPGVNESLLGPFQLWNYIQPFAFIIFPNVLFYSAIVFAIIVFTRNMNIGFMVILAMIIIQQIAVTSSGNVDDTFYYSLFDPMASVALQEITEYWTPIEQNKLTIPMTGVLLYNRLLWCGISLSILFLIIKRFNFAQNAMSFSFSKKKVVKAVKKNFSKVERVIIPEVATDFSFSGKLKTLWHLIKNDTRYIITGWPFIIITFLAIVLTFVMMSFSQLIFNTAILPKTWTMLAEPSTYMVLFSFLLIHLYSGFLMDRARMAHLNQIVDVTPTKNWIFLVSKGVSLFIMTAFLQAILIFCGLIFQTIKGFYDYQIDLYLFQTFFINVFRYVPWILLALLVHTLIKNKWVGLVTLLIIAIAVPLLQGAIGVEQAIYDFNSGGTPSPSDFNGYGTSLARFYTFRVYWISFGIILLMIAIVFYRRGTGMSVKHRLAFAKARLNAPIISIAAVSLVIFLGIGSYSWYINNVENERLSGKETEELRVNGERELGKFAGIPQPKLIAVNTFMDMYTEERNFKAGATFTMVNQDSVAIDTLHVTLREYPTEITLDRKAKIVYENEDYDYRMYQFEKPMLPGDTLIFKFTTENKPNIFLDNNSPVSTNGTFVNSFELFPSIGYNDGFEIRNTQVREKYNLPPKDRLPDVGTPGSRDRNYLGEYSDWIDFEATLSTSSDQIAIAPGYLIKEWNEDGRRYFHYKMDSKMLNFYSFLSGEYEVMREEYKGINLEIYHHPDHTYNLDRMMKGMKEGLDYFNANYTPYQHRQVRIIEFPKQKGSFAQAFANTIPFSEGVGFVADVDDEDQDAVDYPLAITAHELAHQWWAHQVIGAQAKGATLLSESMSEYSSLKVLESVYGKNQMRRFLKDAMNGYLTGRTNESIKEQPLMYNENQQYIHYQKGSLVLYAISDYIGEENFNKVAKNFAEKYQFKGNPYPVATEFVDDIRKVTPDSLQYLITDMFETITLYDNKVDDATYTALPNGKYAVNVKAVVSKYRSYEKGKKDYKSAQGDSLTYTPEGKEDAIVSMPLADYIEIGVFGEKDKESGNENVLFLKKLKVNEIHNSFDIIVDEKPVEAGIDPFSKLIDRRARDNRKKVSEASDSSE